MDRPNSSFLCIFLCEENGGFQQSEGGEQPRTAVRCLSSPPVIDVPTFVGSYFFLSPQPIPAGGGVNYWYEAAETRAAEVTVLLVALKTGCCPGFIQRQDPLGKHFLWCCTVQCIMGASVRYFNA